MKLELRRVTVATPRARDARRAWPERQSLLLRVSDAQGRYGIGEASPLPGYSPDTLEDAEAALQAVDVARFVAALDNDVWAALGAVARLAPKTSPSARMALETAALDWLGQRHAKSAPELLGASAAAKRSLAELVGLASSPTHVEASQRAVEDGFGHLKLKLGTPGKLAEELNAVKQLRERFAGVSLRLDANGSFDQAELATAWPALSSIGIELFEEPGPAPEQLPAALPLALDESLQGLDEAEAAALIERSRARCVVLKPTALGGLHHCWRLAERARELGVGAVVSHCFEGPFAWRAAAALALSLPPGPAHGLAPHAGLAAWQLTPLPVRRGQLEAWSEPGLGSPAEPGFP